MSAAVLDINDRELRLWREGELVLSSPGYALLEGGEYRFGEVARAQARLQPRQVRHGFWQRLDTRALQPAFGAARHSADLVHGHLQAIFEQGRQPEQIIIAAPGSMDGEQLSLLLGIAEQCPFEVVGLVERGVCAASTTALEASARHLDWQLHQTLVTRLECADGEIGRVAATAVPGTGWLNMLDSIAGSIADACIRQTRFDPRRKAGSEQRLYDQLPGLLDALSAQGECELELAGHRVRVEYAALAESCAGALRRIVRGIDGAQVLIDPSLALLPGLREALPESQTLAPDSVARAVATQRSAIVGEAGELRFVTRLRAARRDAPSPASQRPEPAATAPAGSRCGYRIEYRNRRITCVPERGDRAGAPLLNGQPVTAATALRAGDILSAADGGPSLVVREA